MSISTFAIYILVWLLGIVTFWILARLGCRAWARTVTEMEQKRNSRKDQRNGPR